MLYIFILICVYIRAESKTTQGGEIGHVGLPCKLRGKVKKKKKFAGVCILTHATIHTCVYIKVLVAFSICRNTYRKKREKKKKAPVFRLSERKVNVGIHIYL